MVYIDTKKTPYRGMLMAHMMADSTAELLAMADTIGIARRHLQNRGTAREHFDICQAKKALALSAGALEVRPRDLIMLARKRAGLAFDPLSPTCRK